MMSEKRDVITAIRECSAWSPIWVVVFFKHCLGDLITRQDTEISWLYQRQEGYQVGCSTCHHDPASSQLMAVVHVLCDIGYQRFSGTTSRLYQPLTSWAMWVSKDKWEFLLGKMLWAHFRQVLTRQNSASSVLTVRLRTEVEVKEGDCYTIRKKRYFFPLSLFMGIYSEIFHICFSSLAVSSWHLSL